MTIEIFKNSFRGEISARLFFDSLPNLPVPYLFGYRQVRQIIFLDSQPYLIFIMCPVRYLMRGHLGFSFCNS